MEHIKTVCTENKGIKSLWLPHQKFYTSHKYSKSRKSY